MFYVQGIQLVFVQCLIIHWPFYRQEYKKKGNLIEKKTIVTRLLGKVFFIIIIFIINIITTRNARIDISRRK